MLLKFKPFFIAALEKQVPSTGLGVFRVLYGLVGFQEIIFLLYFNHLIFDPIPYLDVEYPMITFFLGLWAINTLFIILGYRYQTATLINYIFWIVFVSFTPMQRDFDGGFDQFMTGVAFILIFLPADRSFSIDNLRLKLRLSNLRNFYQPPVTTSILAYIVPVTLCLGFLYFDSAIHKLSSPHWRNGLGAWLPSTQPYYISALDLSWVLNIESLQKLIGYTIFFFQFSFLFLYFCKFFRPFLFIFGVFLHLGITVSLNIYPFGLSMLALYPLVAPISWWKTASQRLTYKTPVLTVYYEKDCIIYKNIIIIIKHFDIFKALSFKEIQPHSEHEAQFQTSIQEKHSIGFYAFDTASHSCIGLDTFIQILAKMRYTLFFAFILRLPGINQLTRHYYQIIVNKCILSYSSGNLSLPAEKCIKPQPTYYQKFFVEFAKKNPSTFYLRMVKIFIFIFFLQLNSTLHYGVLYRTGLNQSSNPLYSNLITISNSLLTLTSTFLGITPHALYLHDHFQGYNHVIAITYVDSNNNEQWLPFVNKEGRLIAPNWGRVHSMWANIAVTPNIDNARLEKFIMKITAFWGIKVNLDLNDTRFIIKLKKIKSPSTWSYDLRNTNLLRNWINVGQAQWKDKSFKIEIPEDFNKF